MKTQAQIKIAWLFPSLANGNYWHPILSEFKQKFSQIKVFTGFWPGFSQGYEGAFDVEVVGETKYVATIRKNTAYKRSYIVPSLKINNYLLQFKPQVIFTSAFSIWTAFSLLLKPLLGWKVVIIFDGVSPGSDQLNAGVRIYARRMMNILVDAFITNSQVGKDYLVRVTKAEESKIFTGTYLVPDVKALLASKDVAFNLIDWQEPKITFLTIGQLIPRKGIQFLLDACKSLTQNNEQNFTLLIIGEGEQRKELENYVNENNLQTCVKILGAMDYSQLGSYIQKSDVFVFPTLEDIWGMVVPEAMAFGKPILCSKWAGSAEMVVEGENGYFFDPHNPEALAQLMQQFIDNPDLILSMGQKSQLLMSRYTPQTASQLFIEVTSLVLGI
jgi:glycosyltransferase involved in cell wall biosynthesis